MNTRHYPTHACLVSTMGGHAMQYRYGLVNRPAGIGCVPKGSFTLTPPLTDDDGRRLSGHGVIVFERELTEQELYSFELSVIADADLINEIAAEVAQDMLGYAASYLKMSEKNPDCFNDTVRSRLRDVRAYRMHVGDFECFVALVKKCLADAVA